RAARVVAGRKRTRQRFAYLRLVSGRRPQRADAATASSIVRTRSAWMQRTRLYQGLRRRSPPRSAPARQSLWVRLFYSAQIPVVSANPRRLGRPKRTTSLLIGDADLVSPSRRRAVPAAEIPVEGTALLRCETREDFRLFRPRRSKAR